MAPRGRRVDVHADGRRRRPGARHRPRARPAPDAHAGRPLPRPGGNRRRPPRSTAGSGPEATRPLRWSPRGASSNTCAWTPSTGTQCARRSWRSVADHLRVGQVVRGAQRVDRRCLPAALPQGRHGVHVADWHGDEKTGTNWCGLWTYEGSRSQGRGRTPKRKPSRKWPRSRKCPRSSAPRSTGAPSGSRGAGRSTRGTKRAR